MSDPSILFYTGGFTHSFYRHQFACSPASKTMVPATPELLETGIRPDIPAMGTVRYRLVAGAKNVAIRGFRYAGIPNVRRLAHRHDLVHSAQHLLVGARRYVVDLEDASVLFWYRRSLARHPMAFRLVRRLLRSEDCRALLPWTEAARRSIDATFDDAEISGKQRVVYPALHLDRDAPPARGRSGGPVRLLFVGTRFYVKGGLETLRCFAALRRDYDVELTMVTFLPPEAKAEADACPGVTVVTQASPERLRAEFERADIFLLPPHIDTLGLVYLEAFSYGLPCVGTAHFSVPELITDGVTGVIAPSENSYFDAECRPRFDPVTSDAHPLVDALRVPSESYVSGLRGAVARLIEDPALRRDMGDAAFQEVAVGRFSCARRAEAMEQVYEDALR